MDSSLSRSIAALAAVALALVAVPPSASATGPLFVDQASVGGSCDDARPAIAVTAVTPWCTLGRAVEAAPAASLVLIRGGHYPALRVSGLRGRALAFARFGEERAAVDGISISDSEQLRFEGLTLTSGVAVTGASRHLQFVRNAVALSAPASAFDLRGSTSGDVEHVLIEGNVIDDVHEAGDGVSGYGVRAASKVDDITIRGNRITRVQGDGIQTSGVENLVIEGNEIAYAKKAPGSDAHSDPIQVFSPDGDSAIIRSNYIHDNAHAVLIHAGQRGLVLENNVVVRTANSGIKIANAPGARVVNNTVWDNAYAGIELREEIDMPFTDVVFVNNIVQSVSGANFQIFDYNVLGSGTKRGANDVLGSPTFEGAYELAVGSLGIDSASPQWAPLVDRLGRGRRGAPDRGALEHNGLTGGVGVQTHPPAQLPGGSSANGAGRVGVRLLGTHRTPRQVARRGLVLRLSCPAGCRARATLHADRRTARRLRVRPSRRIAEAARQVHPQRVARLRVKPRTSVARRLKKLPRATLRLTVVLTTATGDRQRVRRVVRLSSR